LLPAVILAVLFAILFVPMDRIYGHGALPVGEPSVVTVQLKDAAMPAVQLVAPEGVVIETPGVRIPRDRQISWRVRAMRPGSGDFHVDRPAAVRSMDIRYPKVAWLGWFVAISSVAAVVFGLTWKR
jgi:hypothetical protein